MSYFLVGTPKTEDVVNGDTDQQLSGCQKWADRLNPMPILKNTFAGENGVCNIPATTLTRK